MQLVSNHWHVTIGTGTLLRRPCCGAACQEGSMHHVNTAPDGGMWPGSAGRAKSARVSLCCPLRLPCWGQEPHAPLWISLPAAGDLQRLLAGMDVVDTYALLAAHVAAPVEDAVALLLPFFSPGVVAPAAAQQVAAVDAVRGDIAGSVPCPEGARLWVGLTKIRRVLIVNQIPLCRRLEKGVLSPKSFYPTPGFPVLLHHHLGRAVVFVLQVIADRPEVGLCPPASLDFAASRETVALALQVHVVQDGLPRRENSQRGSRSLGSLF